MMKYLVDHEKFSFKLKFPSQLKHRSSDSYIIKNIDLTKLKASIVTDVKNNKVYQKKISIKKTPHYAFLVGNKGKYSTYLNLFGKNVGYGIEHSVTNFSRLATIPFNYLTEPHQSEYIIVEKCGRFSNTLTILDGVHRVAILLNMGITEVPVAILKKNVSKAEQLATYLESYKDDFLEWYTPIKIGSIVINERTYPKFKVRPEYLTNKERGVSKWDYIIKNNLPSLKNKIVCDVGSNNGLFSILLKKSGAKSVVGYDRDENIYQPTNNSLPRQNNIQQAYFVKNLFQLSENKVINNISFKNKDINKLDFSKLNCDLLYATCILYHFGKDRFDEIIRQASTTIPEIFMQTNLGHTEGELGILTRVNYQKKLLEKYGYSVKIVAPKQYNYPIIYGKKKI